MKTYSVSIVFSDGEFQVEAASYSEAGAINLAMMDARMGTPAHPCFYGHVLQIAATEVSK